MRIPLRHVEEKRRKRTRHQVVPIPLVTTELLLYLNGRWRSSIANRSTPIIKALSLYKSGFPILPWVDDPKTVLTRPACPRSCYRHNPAKMIQPMTGDTDDQKEPCASRDHHAFPYGKRGCSRPCNSSKPMLMMPLSFNIRHCHLEGLSSSMGTRVSIVLKLTTCGVCRGFLGESISNHPSAWLKKTCMTTQELDSAPRHRNGYLHEPG